MLQSPCRWRGLTLLDFARGGTNTQNTRKEGGAIGIAAGLSGSDELNKNTAGWSVCLVYVSKSDATICCFGAVAASIDDLRSRRVDGWLPSCLPSYAYGYHSLVR